MSIQDSGGRQVNPQTKADLAYNKLPRIAALENRVKKQNTPAVATTDRSKDEPMNPDFDLRQTLSHDSVDRSIS